MALSAGDRLGLYEIRAPLGAGGMGEVYRAVDTKLGRDVALKVLPGEFAQDADRLARFDREARSLAALNHPSIATIYGHGEANGARFLVLELVEGETLAHKLSRGPRPVDEALELGRQIAAALEAAHGKGILHRDLKPSNVSVTPEGKVKLLDFGLAKALAVEPPNADAEELPTATPPTRQGVILGTAPYMSPEQARGDEVDRRTDIWSFGCVLYETLSRKRAFSGRTVSDTIAAILEREPDWAALPGDTPEIVRSLLRQCFRKDKDRRLREIADAGITIEDAASRPAMTSRAPVQSPRPAWRRVLPWTLAVLASGLATALLLLVATGNLTPRHAPPAITRFSVALPETQQLTTGTARHVVAFSPDGARIAYVANERLYVRDINQLVATQILGTEGGRSPFFSPDGRWLGFYADGRIKKIAIAGGPPVSLCDASDPSGASWAADDRIVFGQGREGIWQVRAAGGQKDVLIGVDAANGESAHEPQILPTGGAVLFTLGSETGYADDAAIAVQSLVNPGDRRILIEGGTAARYAPTGHLVYARAGKLFGVAFDLASLKVTSDPVPLVEGVMQAALTTSNRTGADFSLSNPGSLAYVPARTESQRRLHWVDRDGGREPLGFEPGYYGRPRISPDGTRLAIALTEQGNSDIWVFDLRQGGRLRLTFDPATDNRPVWTPDGERIVFRSTRDQGQADMFWKRADGSGAVERLTASRLSQVPQSWSRDGRQLVFNQATPHTGWDLMLLAPEGPDSPEPLLRQPYGEIRATISPNGRWMAYMSNETGRPEVYVRPFPDVDEGRWQISREGGASPVWGPNGRELFYRNRQEMILVSVTTSPGFSQGESRVLFTGSYLGGPGRKYDISPDGKRFIMIEADSRRDELIVVSHWFEEMKRLVPTN